jgi:hypothetical protein
MPTINLDKAAYEYFEQSHALDLDRINAFCNDRGIEAEPARAKVYEKIKALVESAKVVMPQESEKTLMVIPKTSVQTDDAPEQITEQYTYTNRRIYLEKFTRTRATEDRKSRLVVVRTDVLVGNLKLRYKVEYAIAADEKVCNWHIQFKSKDFVGDMDELADYLFFNGNVLCKRDELKRILAYIISYTESTTPIHKAYPAVGLFAENGGLFPALDNFTVRPLTDSQESFSRVFYFAMDGAKQEDYKEAMQASVDFIEAMPEKNKYNTLITRGFSCIAPLAYVIKDTPIGIFPYLYLYGMKGSSKTQIAMVSAVYPFGERQPISSEGVESAFRLGMEFSATTLPRAIDEAHDVFQKNLAIFKSGATSTTATKRGNKDKTMDKYSALCTFIFTSNVPPIAAEDDAQGSVMDRVLMLECVSGDDFNKEKYQRAVSVLVNKSPIIGMKLLDYLKRRTEGGIRPLVDEISHYVDIFQDFDGSIPLRRAYCLAEVAVGIKIYTELLSEAGVGFPYGFLLLDDRMLCQMLYEKIQASTKHDELTNMMNFMQYALTLVSTDSKRAAESGIFYAAGNEEVLITPTAFTQYRRYNLSKERPYSKLPELQRDLARVGLNSEITNNKDCFNRSCWSLKLMPDEYYQAVSNHNSL